ncbi:MAG: D-2-hydroxyacid dehydrogenase [Selenomonadaceae bacterium]|nr:D-2-hydroxyacid dehydrogenase [Selenomonadaceae bacterium]
MKIAVLDGYMMGHGDVSFAPVEALGDCAYYDSTDYGNQAKIIEHIGDAEVILVNKVPVTEEIFAACPKLSFICETATGYNNIDLQAARQHGVIVSNVPTYGTNTVAQFAMALLLEICNGVGHHAGEVAKGRWSQCKYNCFWDFSNIELSGKTVGIIGAGRIGMAFARMVHGFGAEIIAGHPRKAGQEFEYGRYLTLDEVYQQADIISLHCPLTAETEKMINEATIAKMKDGVILINTSRGQLVDEAALRAALDSGKVRAAGLDVVSSEPILPDNPLLGAKNCILTPHMAWSATEARQRLMDVCVENVKAYMAGQPINVVS